MAKRQRDKAYYDPLAKFRGDRADVGCLAQVTDYSAQTPTFIQRRYDVRALIDVSACDDIRGVAGLLCSSRSKLANWRGLRSPRSHLRPHCYPAATVRNKIGRRRIKSLKSRPHPHRIALVGWSFSRGAGHASEYMFSFRDLRSSPLFVACFGHHACKYGCLFGKPCRTKLDESNNLR
jgi:hypothetical protein